MKDKLPTLQRPSACRETSGSYELTRQMIRTFEQAYAFVLKVKVCTIFGSMKSPYPSLWDNVALPDRQKGQPGWCEKITAVWKWKNALPATFPNEIFYGKAVGGDAVLMEMNYLQQEHFPTAKKPVNTLSPLARQIYGHIRIEPWYTGELRKLAMEESGCTKSRFDTALKSLQISINIVRSNHPDEERDRWMTFEELYPVVASSSP
ncbi:MAG: hypothetical protein ACI8T1_003218 [Verrucomicrobiales bacterium]|jgi:hypothetical protein